MDRLNILPLGDVNGVKFGDSREDVRKAFGEYTEFKKTPFSGNTTDDFGSFHVFYDSDDKFEAIEVFGEIKVAVDDIEVFPGTIENLLQSISGFVDEDGYYTNYDLSIGITLTEENTIDSILFGCKDYYTT